MRRGSRWSRRTSTARSSSGRPCTLRSRTRRGTRRRSRAARSAGRCRSRTCRSAAAPAPADVRRVVDPVAAHHRRRPGRPSSPRCGASPRRRTRRRRTGRRVTAAVALVMKSVNWAAVALSGTVIVHDRGAAAGGERGHEAVGETLRHGLRLADHRGAREAECPGAGGEEVGLERVGTDQAEVGVVGRSRAGGVAAEGERRQGVRRGHEREVASRRAPGASPRRPRSCRARRPRRRSGRPRSSSRP